MSVLKLLKRLLQWSHILGFLPSYDWKKGTLVTTRFYKVFTLIIHIVTAILTFMQTPDWVTITESHSNTTFVSSVLRSVSFVALILVNIYMLIGLNTFYFKKFSDLIVNLQKIEYELKTFHGINLEIKKTFPMALIFFHLAFIFSVCLDLYEATYFSVKAVIFIIIGLYQFYFVLLLMIIEYNILKQLKISIKSINIAYDKMTVSNNKESRIWNLLKLQLYIGDSTDLFNDIFGWHILTFIFQIVMNLLGTVDVLLQPISHFDDFTGGLDIFLWTFFLTVQGVMLAKICEEVSSEAKDTLTVAFRTLNAFVEIPSLRNKLFILASLCDITPEFSAAGFFSVNYAMLFTFVNLVTTYVIVLIQFSQKQ